jgi:uncharacterized membrane protein YhaH (DUF805 family)
MNKEKNIYNFKAPKSSNEEVNFFNIKGRINRRGFFVRLLFVIAIYFLFLVLFNSGFHKNFGFRFENFYETIHIFIFPLIFSLFVLIQGAKRMHDINKSGWNFLIPFYNLYLAFLPGTKGNNDYGIDYNTAKNITYFDEVEGVDKSEITSRKVKSSRKKPNATDLPESKSNLKSYTYILIILVAVSAWYNIQKNKSTPPINITADSTSVDSIVKVEDSAAPANSFNESDIIDTIAKNNEADPLTDSEINLEDEFEDIPSENVLELVKDPRSKDVANVFWKRGFTLIDFSSNEPIFPELVNNQFIYKIYYSSNEDPIPYYGEYTEQELENHYYYKFINKASCLKFCNSKKH